MRAVGKVARWNKQKGSAVLTTRARILLEAVPKEDGVQARLLHARAAKSFPVVPRDGALDFARMRSEAINLLVDFFEREKLKDEWFIACVCILDRLAAARKFLWPATGDFGVELAAIVTIILKQSNF